MVKLFFPNSSNRSLTIFRSRLSQQITAWVFFSLVTIEGVLFIPSYGRRQVEELRRLEAVSQEVLTSVKAGIMGDMPEEMILRHVQLREESIIKGVALHDASGQLIDSVGEVPTFDADALTGPAAVPWFARVTGL